MLNEFRILGTAATEEWRSDLIHRKPWLDTFLGSNFLVFEVVFFVAGLSIYRTCTYLCPVVDRVESHKQTTPRNLSNSEQYNYNCRVAIIVKSQI